MQELNLDGPRFFYAFVAGGEAIIANQNYLNKINVFPVADADTGTNLASTIHAIVQGTAVQKSLKATLSSVADSALMGAQGNSGIIFAQFLHGLSKELPQNTLVTFRIFCDTAERAVTYLYQSILEPVEGTMLTVIREWVTALKELSKQSFDLVDIFATALEAARTALKNTPNQLKALAEAGVVDAGAKGFVHFLEGVMTFILTGSPKIIIPVKETEVATPVHAPYKKSPYRYCTEAILLHSATSPEFIRKRCRSLGDSLIVAGSQEKLHIHIHTNKPHHALAFLQEYGTLTHLKVDDMHRQHEITHQRKYPIGIITDSACDLPEELLDRYQIQQIPFGIHFGQRSFLDKRSLHTDQFYHMLQTEKNHPTSSQPSPHHVQKVLDFSSEHYPHTIALHISSALSGVYQTAATLAKDNPTITVHNTRQLSVSQGLLVLRVAQAIAARKSYNYIISQLDAWSAKTSIFTDVNTLKYMVRGGRVSPMKGMIARILNLKPIVSLDAEGRGIAYGRSFNRHGNMVKIIAEVKEMIRSTTIREYAIVHAVAKNRADQYAENLTTLLGKEPAFIMPLSPMIGVHNGPGTVAIGLMKE